ncbi:MAG TPA: M1 family metallopeptidase [Cytophagaceae bacterium]|jgi:aminopeptidase N|nr:M1 family metallopeptidase [Cytophagaceae bacterium]
MYFKVARTAFLIVLVALFISSCASSKNSSAKLENTKRSERKKKSAKISKGPYNPSRTLKNDLIHTKLEVSFDWINQYVNGTATLTFKPYFYAQNSLELDAKGMDIMSIVLLEDDQELKYSYDKRIIKIQLPKTYQRTDTFTVKINYVAKPAELTKQGSAAITDDRGLYFINHDGLLKDKPKQLWTQGETESSSCWFPTIDSPNEKTTQEMFITVDTGFTVLSNGEHIYTKAASDSTKTEYWKMDLPHAPYLFMMAVGNFKVVKDQWRDIEVNYYVEPKYEKYAKSIFGNTPEMIEFFSTKLGYNYAWNKYSQVVVRDFVSGAMENTTATVFMESLQCDDRQLLDENWDGIIAHELFHHWFGDLVTCESWSNLPLNESFANYSEYLWSEYKYGKDEADFLDVKEEEEYFDEAESKQEPLIRYYYKDKEDMFDRHSYNKGGRVLHMLRNYVGDDAFFASLKLYLTNKQFKTAEIHDLRLAFEEVTGQDMNWFFNQWFLTAGHPELQVSHAYVAGTLKITITQTQDTLKAAMYKLPLAVDIWEKGNKTRYTIMIDKYKQEFTFPVSSVPQNVLVDAEFQLLGKIFHNKTDAELIFQYKNSDRYRARAVALDKLFAAKAEDSNYNPFSDSLKLEILRMALDDKFWVIREQALDQFLKYTVPEINEFMNKIEKMALGDPKPSVRAKAITLLASYDLKRYVYIYGLGLKAMPYSIVSASLSAYLKSDASDKNEKIETFENTDNNDLLFAIADYYLYSKNLTKYNWFKTKINSKSGRDLYYFLAFFGEYVKLMNGENRADGKNILQAIVAANQHERITKMAKKYLKEIN